jgi:hypothetical protein
MHAIQSICHIVLRTAHNLITATPTKFIDFTLAPDAATAERQVAEAYDIDASLRDRLVAIREDW